METIKIALLIVYAIYLFIEVTSTWKRMDELEHENAILKAALSHEKERAYAE